METTLAVPADDQRSVASTAMTNPYSSPETESYVTAKPMVSTVNGVHIGFGVELQTCGIIDLCPSEFASLYGWATGIVLCGLIGAALGHSKNDVLEWQWIGLLSFLNLSLGLAVALTTFPKSLVNVSTAAMISAGFSFLLLGAAIALRNSSELSFFKRKSSRNAID